MERCESRVNCVFSESPRTIQRSDTVARFELPLISNLVIGGVTYPSDARPNFYDRPRNITPLNSCRSTNQLRNYHQQNPAIIKIDLSSPLGSALHRQL